MQSTAPAIAFTRSTPKYEPLPKPSRLELPRGPLPNPPPAIVVKAALGLRRALHRLADTLCPADLAAFDHLTGLAKTHTLAALARHGVADIIGDGALTALEIAERAGVDADAVHRALRGSATLGFFRLRSDGRFENTRLSRTLMSGKMSRIREFAMYFASGSNAASWGDLAKTIETGEAAFDRVHGTTVWDWYAKHPDEEAMFAHVMMGITLVEAPVIATLYPWKEHQKVCDVGGGRGTLLSEILVRNPSVRGILCEAPALIDSARELLDARGVLARAELVVGNFFDKVPSGADAYVLKNIMHDWDDTSATKILRTVRDAAKPGAKVVICESIVERGSRDPKGTLADIQMMVGCSNGRERGVDEMRSLFRGAGFELGRVFPYPTISVIEGVAT
jgi:predicted protein tyrosine phosphatase